MGYLPVYLSSPSKEKLIKGVKYKKLDLKKFKNIRKINKNYDYVVNSISVNKFNIKLNIKNRSYGRDKLNCTNYLIKAYKLFGFHSIIFQSLSSIWAYARYKQANSYSCEGLLF